MLPERTRHLDFGAVAAAWGLLADLGVAAIIDEEAGAGPPGLPLSPGTYLALAALNRVVAPCSKAPSRTGGTPRPRTGSPRSPPRRWITAGSGTPCTPSPLEALPRIEEKLALARCARSGLDAARWRWT